LPKVTRKKARLKDFDDDDDALPQQQTSSSPLPMSALRYTGDVPVVNRRSPSHDHIPDIQSTLTFHMDTDVEPPDIRLPLLRDLPCSDMLTSTTTVSRILATHALAASVDLPDY
jgi:hypothetical protein